MRTLLWFILGYGLAVGAALCAIAAGGLMAIGVILHLLLKCDPGMIDIISFEPSSIVARAPWPAAAAIGFLTLYLLASKRLQAEVSAGRLAH